MLVKSKPLVAAGIVAVAVFFVTAMLVLGGYSRGVDNSIIAFFNGHESGGLTAVLKVITFSGEFYCYLVVCALLLVIPQTRVDFGVPLTIVVVIAGALNALLKVIFREPRPDTHRLISESGYGFPSGHAMFAAAFACMAILLLIRFGRRRAMNVAGCVVLVLYALAVGTSRVYLGVHWPVDILGGYLAGFFTMVATIMAWDAWSVPITTATRHAWTKMLARRGSGALS